MFKHNNPIIALGQAYRGIAHGKPFYAALSKPRDTQTKKLLQIIRANEKSAFGKKHHFERIHSVQEFQNFVPPSTYEDLSPYIEAAMEGQPEQLTVRPPLMFATTSGTTGTPKFIPVTEAHLKDYTHAFQVHNWALINDHPLAASQPEARYLIFASNDHEGFTKCGLPYGAVSGLLRRRQSKLVQKYFALPAVISQIKDVEIKYYTVLRLALCQNITAILGCNPSTFLLMADALEANAESLIKDIAEGGINPNFRPPQEILANFETLLRADTRKADELQRLLQAKGHLLPKEVWPNLKLLSCWKGGPMPFYLERLPEKYGNLPTRDFGYMASEGRGTIPLRDQGAGGVAALTSHFFEFVPEEEMDGINKRYLTLDQLELGGRYYIHFTTNAGLFRYNINDLMQVCGFEGKTPVLKFVQKGLGVSSITGEKLTEEQVHRALRHTVQALNISQIDHFTLSVELSMPPYYKGFVELKDFCQESLLKEFARVFDHSLQSQNIEYKDKRLSNRLGELCLQTLPPGTFTKLRQKRVQEGAPEAQVKIPFLSGSGDFAKTIETLIRIPAVLK